MDVYIQTVEFAFPGSENCQQKEGVPEWHEHGVVTPCDLSQPSAQIRHKILFFKVTKQHAPSSVSL